MPSSIFVVSYWSLPRASRRARCRVRKNGSAECRIPQIASGKTITAKNRLRAMNCVTTQPE
jgi:hypothetical protein